MFDTNKKGNQFDLFGYDIMVDEEMNCWLIEVNSSPAMDYSTDVTERLVKMVLEDTMKVVVDYHYASNSRKHNVDTGLYNCVYRARRAVDKPNNFNLNLAVQGKSMSKKQVLKY